MIPSERVKKADELFERAGKLKGLFNTRGFWLCNVYGIMKSSMTELQLKLMEEELERSEKTRS